MDQNQHIGYLNYAKPPGYNDGIKDLAYRKMAEIHVKMDQKNGYVLEASDNSGLSLKAAKS